MAAVHKAGAELALVLLIALVGCSTSSPTSPAGRLALVIRPDVEGVVVLQRQTFTAWNTDGVREQQVPGRWSIDDLAIATVDGGGTVAGLQQGRTVLRVAHESLSTARTLLVVEDVGGTWLGEARVVECSRVSGPGPNACRVGFVLPFQLVIRQQGPGLDGMLQLYREPRTGAVNGSITPAGAIQLSGKLLPASPPPDEVEIVGWETSVSASENMTGRFRTIRRFQNFFGPQVFNETLELLSVVRAPSVTSTAFGFFHALGPVDRLSRASR